MADYQGWVVFDVLQLWIDPVRRPGPAAMAVDEWLLETADVPVLRVYEWQGDWGSVGYFGGLSEARAAFSGVEWVRRWTGGGIVDHRADWTYTVIAPAGQPLAGLRGAESYQCIHAALAEALCATGIHARLSTGLEQTGAAACFENPVSHDLVDESGLKLAGAGQRRTKLGLLHQGSVAHVGEPVVSLDLAKCLATALAVDWDFREFHPPEDLIAAKVSERYGLPAWTARRP